MSGPASTIRQNAGREYLIHMPNRLVLASLLSILVWISVPPHLVSAGESELWKALRTDHHFALLRHALAPGTGDPPNFKLGQCATQRNLSPKGRSQAVKIGHRFRAHGLEKARVYSSQWCRCIDTATLLALGMVRELPALNSFFQRYEREDAQIQALKKWLAGQDLNQPLVLVTHQVNITALTGVYPVSGELVIVHRSGVGILSVVGTLAMD